MHRAIRRSGLGVVAEGTGRPRVDLHRCSMSVIPRRASAAMYSGCSIVVNIAFIASVNEQRRPHPFDLAPLAHLARRHRDDDLDHRQLGTGDDERAQLPVDRVAGLPLRQDLLGGLVEHDVGEAGGVGQPAGGADDLDGGSADLVAGDHGERMDSGHRRIIMTPVSDVNPGRPAGRVGPGARVLGGLEVRGAFAAAVHEDVRPADVGRERRREEQADAGDVVRACPCGRAARSRRPRRCRPRRRRTGAPAR